MQFPVLVLVFALGLRHGLDADHLAAIDGFARFKPSRWNGILFALGHGGVVTALAAGVYQFLGKIDLSWLFPWLFLGVAAANLIRLLRPKHHHMSTRGVSWIALGPLTMGVLLAVSFETVTQLSALSLAQHVGPLWLGAAFTLGMMITDGIDGLLAARVQRGRGARAEIASLAMGWVVVVVSAGFGLAHFAGLEAGSLPLVLGAVLFMVLVGLRMWTIRDPHAVPVDAA
jgi:nickel/cobalt transporter (NiCoT) family protein